MPNVITPLASEKLTEAESISWAVVQSELSTEMLKPH